MFSTTANNDSPETDPKQPKQSGVTADYCTKLQQWMWQCYWGYGQWQSWGPWRPGSTFPWGPWSPFGWGPGSTFPWVPPYTLTSPGTSIQTPQSHASSPSSGQQVLDTRNWSIYPYQLTFPVSSAPHPGGPQSDEISPRTPTTDPLWPGQQQNGNPAPQAGQEYTIPSPLQRFLAETVDFFILFCVKATIVLCIMRLSGMKDFAKFIIQFIVEEIDENTSMEDLQKMMAVALVHRVLVCVYETVCIWSAGGATPGKFLLGLRVVTCDTSTLVRPNRVLVVPATNVSLSASTVRALNKNFSIAFLFPIFITLLFFQHNRTVYDIVAGTIVVQRRRDR